MFDLEKFKTATALADGLAASDKFELIRDYTVLAINLPIPASVEAVETPVFERNGIQYVCVFRDVAVEVDPEAVSSQQETLSREAVRLSGFYYVFQIQLRRSVVLGYVSKRFRLVICGVTEIRV